VRERDSVSARVIALCECARERVFVSLLSMCVCERERACVCASMNVCIHIYTYIHTFACIYVCT